MRRLHMDMALLRDPAAGFWSPTANGVAMTIKVGMPVMMCVAAAATQVWLHGGFGAGVTQ